MIILIQIPCSLWSTTNRVFLLVEQHKHSYKEKFPCNSSNISENLETWQVLNHINSQVIYIYQLKLLRPTVFQHGIRDYFNLEFLILILKFQRVPTGATRL